MNQINFKSFDLNLLSVFVLLMQENNVSRVADRLSLGQPAVSHALARLRSLVGDPLFIRAGRRMEPTPRAIELFAIVGPAIEALEGAVRAAQPFNPQTSDRTFKVAVSDDIQIAYLPRLRQRLSEEMPLAKLVVIQSDYRQAAQTLEHQSASIVLGYLNTLPAAAKIRKLKRVGYKVLMTDTGQITTPKKVTLKSYCDQPHILVTFAGDLVGYMDETLDKLGLKRNICLSVPAFAVLPYFLKGTNQLATVPAYVADALSGTGDLMSLDLPFDSPKFDLSMAWSATTDKDPAEMHLRSLIREVLLSGPSKA